MPLMISCHLVSRLIRFERSEASVSNCIFDLRKLFFRFDGSEVKAGVLFDNIIAAARQYLFIHFSET